MKKVNISEVVFEPAKLVTEVTIRNAVRKGGTSQQKTIDATYDGAAILTMNVDVDSLGNFGDESKESVIISFPQDGDFIERSYMRAVGRAKQFLLALDAELLKRYGEEEWYKGSGANNFGAITGPLHKTTKKPLMQPQDLWNPILKDEGYGPSMQLKYYKKNPAPITCAATGEALTIDELKEVLYPFKTVNRGNGEVAVRTKSKKGWHLVGNPGSQVAIGDHEQTFIVPKVRAQIDFRMFGWFMTLNGAGLALAIKEMHVFVPFYRTKLLGDLPVVKKIAISKPDATDLKTEWCNEFVRQLAEYQGTKRKHDAIEGGDCGLAI